MTDTSAQHTRTTIPNDEYGAEIHPKHSFAPIEKQVESFGKTFTLEVPETEVQLDDSPTGPNAPQKLYRTRGPWAEPTEGARGTAQRVDRSSRRCGGLRGASTQPVGRR